jgi:hypothetical protein
VFRKFTIASVYFFIPKKEKEVSDRKKGKMSLDVAGAGATMSSVQSSTTSAPPLQPQQQQQQQTPMDPAQRAARLQRRREEDELRRRSQNAQRGFKLLQMFWPLNAT